MKGLNKIAYILVIIGALNWLFIGLVGRNYLDYIVGSQIAKIVYVLVGLSALVLIFNRRKASQPAIQ